jgi:hypothetical protein
MVAATDFELVRTALSGDARAWERVVALCEDMAARYVSARGPAPEESAAQVRSALEAVLVSLPQYRGETPLFVFAFGAMARGLAPWAPTSPRHAGEAQRPARAADGR